MRPICDVLGVPITISGVSSTYNTRGDETRTYTSIMLSSAVVEIASAEDDLVREGVLRNGDIVVWVDESDDSEFLVNGSIIAWKPKNHTVSGHYIITNTIENEGHIEIFAKKE